jgi:DNA-binding winged helix-turn-helix (wHTH) protein
VLISHARPTELRSGPAQVSGRSGSKTEGTQCARDERPAQLVGSTVREAMRTFHSFEVNGGSMDHTEPNIEFQFAGFQLQPRSRLLLHHGRPVDIGGRAFDMLHVLVRAGGGIVTNTEIVSRVWPDLFVDEINLRVQVFYLRKALGGDRGIIKNVPGRGYLLAAYISCGPTVVASKLAGLMAGPHPEIRCRENQPIGHIARPHERAAIHPGGANDNEERPHRLRASTQGEHAQATLVGALMVRHEGERSSL